MQRSGIIAAGMLLLAGGFCRAGVYSTLEPPLGPRPGKDGVAPLPFSRFQDEMYAASLRAQEATRFPLLATEAAGSACMPSPAGPFVAVIVLQASPQLPSALRNYWRLTAQQQAGELSVADKVNLSYYLIYLGRADEAVALLRELASDRQKNNFMASANLAAAYLAAGNLRAALGSTDDALHFLKRGWTGWGKEQVEWYRRMEEVQKKLIRLRLREAAKEGRAKPPENVDDLFGVRFVGEDGDYQAGRIAEAEKAKLPKDAFVVAQQLVLWYPNDTRLYWLVGELLNADGQVPEARTVLDQCSDPRGLNAVELRRHRQVLAEAMSKPETPVSWVPDTRRLLAVGIGAGLFVALLLYWQLRELRRRRK